MLMFYGQVLLYEHHLLFINEKIEFKILKSKFLTRFELFFGQKWPFLNLNKVFGH